MLFKNLNYNVVHFSLIKNIGLIPANERKVMQDYYKILVKYDRMTTPNSHKLFQKIIALSLMENTDKVKMNEIITKIKQIIEEVR